MEPNSNIPNFPPHEPEQPICNNPAWYELYATTEEKQAFAMMIENRRNEDRYRKLLEDLDLNDSIRDFFNNQIK